MQRASTMTHFLNTFLLVQRAHIFRVFCSLIWHLTEQIFQISSQREVRNIEVKI